MNSLTDTRLSMNRRGIEGVRHVGEGPSRMPMTPMPVLLRHARHVAASLGSRALQFFNAKNALDIDRVDLRSPDCMGVEAWIRDVEGEEAQRAQAPVLTEIQRIHDAERQVEEQIARQRFAAVVFAVVVATALVSAASYVALFDASSSSPVLESAPRG